MAPGLRSRVDVVLRCGPRSAGATVRKAVRVVTEDRIFLVPVEATVVDAEYYDASQTGRNVVAVPDKPARRRPAARGRPETEEGKEGEGKEGEDATFLTTDGEAGEGKDGEA